MKKYRWDGYVTYLFFLLLFVTFIWDKIYRNGEKSLRIGLIFVTIIGIRIFFKKSFLRKSNIMYCFILVFIFISMYLANVMNFYNIKHFDKILHFSSGFMLALFGLLLYLFLFGNPKENNSKNCSLVIFIIIFSIASAGFWEIWEFTTDNLLNLHAQNGLTDTMLDIILGSLGGIIMSIPIYFYSKGKNIKMIDKIVKEFLD